METETVPGLKTIASLIQKTVATFPIPEVFHQIAKQLKNVFGFDSMSISLVKEDNKSAIFYFVCTEQNNSRFPTGSVYPLCGSITEEALKTGEPVIVEDAIKRKYTTDGIFPGEGVRSRLGLPVVYGNKVIGVLSMESCSAGHFSQKHVAWWKEISPFIAVVTENARLMHRLEESAGALAREVAERARAESNLHTLSYAIEQSPSAVIITDTKGVIEYVNPKFTRLTGYTPEEVIGKNPNVLKSGEKPQEDYEWLWKRITSGSEWKGEFHNKKKTGESYWASASISPARDRDGVITHFIGIQEDITERKLMEEDLRKLNDLLKHSVDERTAMLAESEDKFRKISASAQDAIIMLDGDEKVSYWNEAAEKTFLYSKEEAMGRHLHTLIIPEGFRVRHLEGFKNFQITGQGPAIGKTIELAAVKKDGSEFPIELSLSGVKHNEEWHAIGIVRDITERKRTNDRLLAEIRGRKRVQQMLKETVAKLEHSNVELQQFAYVASHDLQEPLRMVSSYTQLLGRRYKGKLDADADEFIAYAVDGAVRMQALINDLLAYSRVGTRRKPFEPTDCATVFNRAATNLKIAIQESGAVVTHDTLPTVMADASQLTQLFQNLIGNAVKFRGNDAPRVHVSAVQTGNEWTFSVRDNGIGVDPQYAERIFVIFQRLHTKDKYPGSGIGLTICKKIVERHGGKIWLESEVGKGATFYFTIPIPDETQQQADDKNV